MNPKVLGGVFVVILIVGGAFYSGTVYAKSKTPTRSFTGQGQYAGMGGARTRGGMGGLTVGQILSKDATSITIQMPDNSTKIVLVSTSTQVLKAATGALSDLSVGTNVAVSGTANSDGSLTAQSVQIRPAGSLMPGAGGQRTSQQ